MTTSDLRGVLRSARTSLTAMQRMKLPAAPFAHQYVGDYASAIAAEDWDALASAAKSGLAATQPAIRGLSRVPAKGRSVFDAVPALEGASLGADAGRLNVRPDWRRARSAIIDGLVDEGVVRRDAVDYARRYGHLDLQLPTLRTALLDAASASADSAGRNVYAQVRVLAGALLADAVARFEAAASAGTSANTSTAAVRAARRPLDAAVRDLHTNLRTKRPDDAAALALAQRGEAVLAGRWPETAAAVRLDRPPDSGTGPPALAIEVADLIREAIAAVVIGTYVGWLAAWGPVHPIVATLMADARRLPLDGAAIAPVSIGDLGSRYDGALVTVTGTASAVTTHGSRPSASSVLLSERGATVRAVAPNVELGRVGLAAGAAVRLAGTYDAAAGAVTVRVVDPAEPACFRERLHRLTRGCYSGVPYGLDASWSWEAGPDGVADQLASGIWFS